MPAIVPSHIAKVTRAKKHIWDLKAEIDRYSARHPYTVADRRKGKKKTWHLAFTADPANTDIPIIAADAIYNLRSALDHVMSSLVPSNQRNSVIFPIYFQGVWEPARQGENEQRIKERARWASDTKALSNNTLAILKVLQPPDDSGQPDEVHLLRLINRLSNRDRHEKLPVIAAGLSQLEIKFRRPSGAHLHAIAHPTSESILEDNAQMHDMPDDAMNVKIKGVPVIAIQVGTEKGGRRRYVEIPEKLTWAATFIEKRVFAPLAPFVRR